MLDKEMLQKFGLILALILEISVRTFLGCAVGVGASRYFQLQNSLPAVFGSLLGMFSGFYKTYRILRSSK